MAPLTLLLVLCTLGHFTCAQQMAPENRCIVLPANGSNFSFPFYGNVTINTNCKCKQAQLRIDCSPAPVVTVIDVSHNVFPANVNKSSDGIYIAKLVNAEAIEKVIVYSSEGNDVHLRINNIDMVDCADGTEASRSSIKRQKSTKAVCFRVAGGYWLHPIVWIVFLVIIAVVLVFVIWHIFSNFKRSRSYTPQRQKEENA